MHWTYNMATREKPNKLWDYIDKIYKVGSFGGIILILWLNSHYVTIEKFEANNKDNTAQHLVIGESLNKISLTLAIMENNSSLIKDHEERLRIIEGRQADMSSRVIQLEKIK